MSRVADEGLRPLYSNFDHKLDEAVADILTQFPNRVGEHCAWEFHGCVWFDGQKWHEEVNRYHSLVATYEGDSVLEVIEAANDNWGHE